MFDHDERLPKEAASAARARRALERLDGRLAPEVLANAKLLVSELVANAVDHVPDQGEIGLAIGLREGTLRVEVHDPGPGFAPRPRVPGQARDSGWGLHFVDRLSDRWAVEGGASACVWFEIDGAASRLDASA